MEAERQAKKDKGEKDNSQARDGRDNCRRWLTLDIPGPSGGWFGTRKVHGQERSREREDDGGCQVAEVLSEEDHESAGGGFKVDGFL